MNQVFTERTEKNMPPITVATNGTSESLRINSGSSARSKVIDILTKYRVSECSDYVIVRQPWESREAICQLLEVAIADLRRQGTSHIQILTSSFPWSVYGPPAAAMMHDFLKSGGRIKLLIWNSAVGSTSETLCKALAGVAAGRFEVKFSGTLEGGEKLSHMFVVNARAYRLEAPHSALFEGDVSEYQPEIPARICFNDKTGGKQLSDSFESIWRVFG